MVKLSHYYLVNQDGTRCSTTDNDWVIAVLAMLLNHGALVMRLVKSRSSGCRNCEACIPLSGTFSLTFLSLFLLVISVLVVVVTGGAENALMRVGMSDNSNAIIFVASAFIFVWL